MKITYEKKEKKLQACLLHRRTFLFVCKQHVSHIGEGNYFEQIERVLHDRHDGGDEMQPGEERGLHGLGKVGAGAGSLEDPHSVVVAAEGVGQAREEVRDALRSQRGLRGARHDARGEHGLVGGQVFEAQLPLLVLAQGGEVGVRGRGKNGIP